MDQLLALILALISFVFLIFLIGRAVKMIIVLGLVLTTFFVLVALGLVV